jgi:EAL domain-containing protein (putative c-di-GMP-specific phosphodiesterase class I)
MQKLQQCLETPVAIVGGPVDTRASIGLAVYPAHGEDLDSLLRHADAAMYVAKRNGTGVEVYDPALVDDSRNRLSLMSELRHAVANDELVLHYQPKINLADPSELHVEALVRWQHETRGFVSPDLFIPFAERTGFITTLTDWVVGHACAQLRRWRDDGLRMHVALNISTRDLKDPDFFGRVVATVAMHDCDPTWLAFEITETSILGNPGPALENLNRLHALGCRISIDDFGTGYSSLAYLSELPVDELKIDRSFVMGMIDRKGDAAIVRSTIDLGHNMGLTVVAEGVETEAMLDRLTDMGCDVAQGYLISRPLAAAALEEWLASTRWTRPSPMLMVADYAVTA